MTTRILGRTGIAVSELAFGCVEIGMPYGIGVRSAADMPGEDAAVALLQAALASGINFFDTARLYGRSEHLLGRAFRHCRGRVVIATKCRHFGLAGGSVPEREILEGEIRASLEESLTALQTGYVDVFMLHQADERLLTDASVQAVFSGLKREGLIRAAGVSTYTNSQTQAALDTGAWEVIQVPFNLMDQRQQALFAQAQGSGTALVIRSVLLKGLLSTRGTDLHPALAPVTEHIKRYGALTGRLGISLATLAIRFALSYREVASVLVGIDQKEYLEESLAAAGTYLPEAVQQEAAALAYRDPAFLDLPAWDRKGWLT